VAGSIEHGNEPRFHERQGFDSEERLLRWVPFIVSPDTVDLSHIKRASAGTAVVLRDIVKGTTILGTYLTNPLQQYRRNQSQVRLTLCGTMISISLGPLKSTWLSNSLSDTYDKQAVTPWPQTLDTNFFYTRIQAFMPWQGQYQNVNGEYMEVWCVTSATNVQCKHQSQNTVLWIISFTIIFWNFIALQNTLIYRHRIKEILLLWMEEVWLTSITKNTLCDVSWERKKKI